MVKTNDRMPEPRQHPFSKGRRRTTAHQMMRVSWRAAKCQEANANTQTNEFLCHAVSPSASLIDRVRLDIPGSGPDNPQPDEAVNPCQTTSLPASSMTPSRGATRLAQRPKAPCAKRCI